MSSGLGYESDIEALAGPGFNESIRSVTPDGLMSSPLLESTFNRTLGSPVPINASTVLDSSVIESVSARGSRITSPNLRRATPGTPLVHSVSPVSRSTPVGTPTSIRGLSPIGARTPVQIRDPNATRVAIAQDLLRDLLAMQQTNGSASASLSATVDSAPLSATASASAILNQTITPIPNYIDNLLSVPVETNAVINSAAILADPILVDTLDPARMVATQQLKELAAEHLKIQEADLNAMLLLKKDSEALQERVEQCRERIDKEHQAAQEALQKKMQADQKALQQDAENRGRKIQKLIESLHEYGQEASGKFVDAQQKVIGDYTKLMQKRK